MEQSEATSHWRDGHQIERTEFGLAGWMYLCTTCAQAEHAARLARR